MSLAWSARSWATARIKSFVSGKREQAITMALVLGVSNGLDSELQNAYSISGAMHVLSVSGLHVGIIYGILLLLLKPITSFSWGRWVLAAISLIALWSYALVTGMSPSVLRAVVMFSFIVLAKPFGRNTNIYNTLAASAFLLLCFDPYLILSVGCQLSYLAVFGIIALQKKLYMLWEPASGAVDKVWQMTSVSIAAQLATFPLGLYYFHQFPVYFLISNMLVIPLSTAVLLAGILLLVISPFAAIAKLVAWLIQWLVSLLNGSVFLIEDLPGSVIDNVKISLPQCLLLMVLMVTIFMLLNQRTIRWLFISFAVVLIFTLLQWRHVLTDVREDELIVYNIRGHRAFETIRHGQAVLDADTALQADDQNIRRHILPHHITKGVGRLRIINFEQEGRKYGFRVFHR